jgi:hypothetical protein
VKTSGNNVRGHIVRVRNVWGSNIRGRIVPVTQRQHEECNTGLDEPVEACFVRAIATGKAPELLNNSLN